MCRVICLQIKFFIYIQKFLLRNKNMKKIGERTKKIIQKSHSSFHSSYNTNVETADNLISTQMIKVDVKKSNLSDILN